jgi:hypothetical protein
VTAGASAGRITIPFSIRFAVVQHFKDGSTVVNGGRTLIAAKSAKKALFDLFRPVLSLRRRKRSAAANFAAIRNLKRQDPLPMSFHI